MVTVPGAQDIGAVQRSLVNQPGPTSLAGEGAFGVQLARADQVVGRATARAGTELGDRVLREQIDDNIREMKGALVRQSELEKLVYFGDGTAENPGFGNLQGQAAIDGLQTARERLTEGQAEISKSLKNNRQRQLYAAASAQGAVDAQARLNNHTSQQRKVANAAMAVARQQEAKDNAVFDFRDDDRMATNFAIVRAEALTEGAERGLVGQALISHTEAAVSAVAVQAVEAAIAEGDIARGRKLLAKYKKEGQLDGTDIPALTKALKEGNVKFASQEFTDAIIGQGLAEGWTPQQFMAAARAVEAKDPEVRLATVRRMTLFNAEQLRAKQQARVDAGLTADQFVENGGKMLDLDPSVKELLTTEKLRSLAIAEARKATGEATVTLWPRFDFYTLELPRTDPDAVKNIDLGVAKMELAPPQFAIVERMVIKAREIADPTTGPVEEQPFTPNQVFNSLIKGVPSMAPRRREGETRKTKRSMFMAQFMNDVTTLERNNGPKKKLTATEHEAIFNDLLDKVVVGTFDFGLFEIDDEERLFTVEIPNEFRPQIIEAIEDAGGVATEAEIRRTFLRFKAAQ